MHLELNPRQANQYLSDLVDVYGFLARALVAAAELAERTPGGCLPEGMLNSLVGSWENLDSRIRTVYCEIYGYLPSNDELTAYIGAVPQEGLGEAELQ